MASVQTTGAACATTGAIARGAAGEILSCQAGTWKESRFWRDPVANFASLPACAAANAGETRVVMGYATAPKQRIFSCDGAAWVAAAVDNNGLMTAGKYMVNDVVTEGTACTPNGLVAKDTNGLLLSCQSGAWKKQYKPNPLSQNYSYGDFKSGCAGIYNGVFKAYPCWYVRKSITLQDTADTSATIYGIGPEGAGDDVIVLTQINGVVCSSSRFLDVPGATGLASTGCNWLLPAGDYNIDLLTISSTNYMPKAGSNIIGAVLIR